MSLTLIRDHKLIEAVERALSYISGSNIKLNQERGLAMVSASNDRMLEGCVNVEIRLDNSELVDEASDYINALKSDYLSTNDIPLLNEELWIETTFVLSIPGCVILFDSRNMGKRKSANVFLKFTSNHNHAEEILKDFKRKAVESCRGSLFDFASKIESGEVDGTDDPVVLQKLYELATEAADRIKAMTNNCLYKNSPSV